MIYWLTSGTIGFSLGGLYVAVGDWAWKVLQPPNMTCAVTGSN